MNEYIHDFQIYDRLVPQRGGEHRFSFSHSHTQRRKMTSKFKTGPFDLPRAQFEEHKYIGANHRAGQIWTNQIQCHLPMRVPLSLTLKDVAGMAWIFAHF